MDALQINIDVPVKWNRVIVTANEGWNLINFRGGIIQALIEEGYMVIAAAPPDEAMASRLKTMGCVFEPLPVDPAGLHPLRDLRTLFAYLELMVRYSPSAFLSWTIKPNIYGSIAARFLRIPAFPNVSGLGTVFIRRGLLNWIVRQMYKLAFARAAQVFFQNHEDRDLFISDHLVRADQAIVVPGSGVDTSRFAPLCDARPAPGHFLMIARLIADKGVREFVEAARRARRINPALRFTLMGQANVANRTAIGAAELKSWVDDGSVDYRPPADDVRPAIAAADVIVLPSYREGMSRVLLEAAAMARPIVTCDVPGCREIVSDGENGFLCRVRDVQSLCAAIVKASRLSDALWRHMGRAGRSRVERDFSEGAVIAAYRTALYDAGIRNARTTTR